MINYQTLRKNLSKVPSLPLLSKMSPAVNQVPPTEVLEGFLASQELAQKAAKEVASLVRAGWTENQAASLLTTYLKDNGVHSFFHDSFAWFGERAGFHGMKSYGAFMPSHRVIQEGEVFILDVAPIYRGFVSDIGYTACLGENAEFNKANTLLKKQREEIPILVKDGMSGANLWKKIDTDFKENGFGNAYRKYPFSVLGHRIHQVSEHAGPSVLRFGWQSFWSFLSRGVLSQLITDYFEGDMTGLWAIEPHLSADGFGAKFEEILVVSPEKVYWLSDHPWRNHASH